LCSPIDPRPFFFSIFAPLSDASPFVFLENGHGRMGQNSSRRLPESVFSWLLLLQDGIYAQYFTAGVLVDDIVDGFLFWCGSRAKKNAFGSSGRNFSRDRAAEMLTSVRVPLQPQMDTF
jgi:hypothetical protein